ncbi:hypothetical protein ID866_8010 [Astraeus odoratus]|nr:hypothetical protein ID866_8010 [Astraeus odoratus]
MAFSFILGTALAVFGGWLRFVCYRTLGDLFTFTLTVRPGHKLITHGPYSIVRHPSYSALICSIMGIVIMQASNTSWMRESGTFRSVLVELLVPIWIFSMTIVTLCVCVRMKEEDRMMEVMFKDEWMSWAGRVRYRLIPWVY